MDSEIKPRIQYPLHLPRFLSVIYDDTTISSYWLNWRFFFCALWILALMLLSAILIWKKEGSRKIRGNQETTAGLLYKDEAWGTCLRGIHPGWLLVYRMISFFVLLALIVANVVMAGGSIFFFYTQWTFALVTIYFVLASVLSIYGCFQCRQEVSSDSNKHSTSDTERGAYVAPLHGESENMSVSISLHTYEQAYTREVGGVCGYAFQIIFQTCAGAVTLTDIVFWLVLYPLLSNSNHRLTFIDICMHSLNAAFLLGDVLLNCLRFPFFRVAYFVLWTCTFVVVQWIIHAYIIIQWPYPFMDLSSPNAPWWYMGIGTLAVICYGVFAAIVKVKQFLLSRLFPNSYQEAR